MLDDAEPVSAPRNGAAGAADTQALAETLRHKFDLFVRGGFRDEDGVWHDGPHRLEADAALDALVARVEALEDALEEAQLALRAQAVAAVQGVLDLMAPSSLPADGWEHDTIIPHTNGYSRWFIGREQFERFNGCLTLVSTVPLTAEQIADRIIARAATSGSGASEAPGVVRETGEAPADAGAKEETT